MTYTMEVWEILVPCAKNDGKPNIAGFHKGWDKKVRAITGGLTIGIPNKGQWISPTGAMITERVIPVRMVCTRDQIDEIVDMTIKYYDQEAVLAYKISNEVILRTKS